MIWFPLISAYSLFTALVIFTLGAGLCCLLSKKAGWSALRVVGAGIVLIIVRCLLPLELPGAHIIGVPTILPEICEWMKSPLVSGVKVWMLVIFIWAMGSAVLLVRLGIALYRQNRLIYAVQIPKDSPTYSVYARTAEKLSCKKCGIVGVSSYFPTAMLAGIFSPHVLLPQCFEEFSEKELDFVFRHEITHFLNHDQQIKLFLRILQYLLWWNPAVYFLYTSIERLLEMRCDQRVCARLSSSEQCEYAGTLLYSVKQSSKRRANLIAVGYTAHLKKGSFEQRFKQIVKNLDKTPKRWITPLIVSLMIALFLSSYVFLIQPAAPGPNYSETPIRDTTAEGEDNFILQYSDGTLAFYKENRFYCYISPDLLEEEPFASTQIYQMQE